MEGIGFALPTIISVVAFGCTVLGFILGMSLAATSSLRTETIRKTFGALLLLFSCAVPVLGVWFWSVSEWMRPYRAADFAVVLSGIFLWALSAGSGADLLWSDRK